MPLTKEQEEKLRKEWEVLSSDDAYPSEYEQCKEWLKSKDNAVFLEEIYPENQCELDYDKVANWWLARTNEALIAQRKEIVEGLRGIDVTVICDSDYYSDGEYVDVYDIFSLPQLTGKQEEDDTRN